ncbi:MAG: hypothetical protein B9S33_10735 [Pedosphaera sp. Tous-C6FEB]|nr:MAG: hypothetical protein B9S33_10735 [Pedosphaera sp. Tous-C6FEB]
MATPLRALLVEANEGDANAVLAALRRAGYEPATERVWTPKALESALQAGGWTIVLAEFQTPSLPGLEVLAMVERGADSGLPVIFVSSEADEDAAVAAVRAGAANYVRKTNLARLQPAIEHALQTAAERRQRRQAEKVAANRARQQAMLAEYAQWALGGLPLPELLTGTAERVAQALDTEFCGVFEVQPGEESLLLCGGAGWQPGCVGHVQLAVAGPSQEALTFRDGELVHVADWSVEQRLEPSALLREHGVASGLAVLVRLRSRAFGVLGAYSSQAGGTTALDGHFLQAMANVLATAIERKRAEESLRESDDRFRTLVDEVKGFAIITLDPEACVQTWNHGAEQLFGYPAADMVGQHLARLYPPEDVELGKPELDLRLAEEMGQFEDEDWRVQNGGGQFWANVVITALRRADGGLRGYGIVTRDMTEQRRAHEALKLNEAKFRSLVNHIPDAVWTANQLGEQLFLSGNAEQIYGYPLADLLAGGRRLGFDRIHPEDAPRVLAAWQNLFTRRERFEVECRYARKDDREIWILVRASAIYEKDGQVVADGITSDITERKRAEAALRSSEERFQMVGRATNDVVWDWDLTNDLLWWGTGFQTLFGYPAGEIEPTIESWTSRVHPEEQARVVAKIHAAIDQGEQLWSDEYRFRRKDGSYAFIYDRGFVIKDTAGRPIRMIGAMQDMTERRQAEEQIRAQARLLDLAGDAIIVRNLNHEVLYWNHGAERIYGWSAAEVRGRRVTELVFRDTKQFETAQTEILEQGEWKGELKQFGRTGREIIVSSRWTLVRDAAGQPASVLVINSDITENKRLESQFLRAQRMESIGTLAGGVAHDLNNILAPIMMSAPLLRMKELPAVDFERLLDTIEINAQRGSDIVRQLLAFGRGIEGERVVVQPRHMIREMSKMARETFPKNISITSEVPDTLWPIRGDPTHLHQILLNLCINARDAMPGGGNLRITAENQLIDEHYAAQHAETKPGPYILLKVADSGHGIPREIMDKIFDPFFTTKEVGKGTGLGLATVMGIIKSHGGVISVSSEIGKGTSFNILLPALPGATAAEADGPRQLLLRGEGETVLVVDDEPGILTATVRLLRTQNYQVLVATDGAEALSVFSKNRDRVQVILTDVMMPEMDGLALVRVVRKISPTLKIIASSGLERDAKFDELRALGVNAFLTKPYSAEKLLRVLREILVQPPGPSA